MAWRWRRSRTWAVDADVGVTEEFLVLPFPVLLEGVEAFAREGDTAFGRTGLCRQVGETTRSGSLEGVPDAARTGVEIEVFPVKAEKFTFAESGAQGEFVERVEPVGADCVEELAGLGCGERLEPPGQGCGGLDVAGQLVFADGVFQRRLEDRVHIGHGRRTAASGSTRRSCSTSSVRCRVPGCSTGRRCGAGRGRCGPSWR
jgi:hypothetical protein